MQINLIKLKREESSSISAASKALEMALEEERGESPVSKIKTSMLSKRHSSRKNGGIRLALRKFGGFGEITHRALKSTTIDSEELVEKYDELKGIYDNRKERYEKRQEKKQQKKDKAEAILEKMKSVAHDFDDLEERFGSIKDMNFGEEDVRLKAKSTHRGVNLDLNNITVKQFEQILEILS